MRYPLKLVREHHKKIENESGFSLIEFFTTAAIMTVLASLSVVGFKVFLARAEYSRAETTLRNAMTAVNIGENDFTDGFTVDYATSGTAGSVLTGDLATLLPGAGVPENVRIGGSLTECDESSSALDLNVLLIAEPCKGEETVRWQRFCGGTQLYQGNISATPCE